MSVRQIRCNQCSSVLRIAASLPGGSKIKCPKCAKVLRLPDTAPQANAVTPASPQKQRPAAGGASPRKAKSAKKSASRHKKSSTGLIILCSSVGGGLALLLVVVLLVVNLSATPAEQTPQAGSSAGQSQPANGNQVAQNQAPEQNPDNAANQNPNPNNELPQEILPVSLKSIGQADPLKNIDPFKNEPLPANVKPLLVLNSGGHTSVVRGMRFTRDGNQLITVSSDKTIRIWDVASGTTKRVLRLPAGIGDEGAVFAMALSPDGKQMAAGGLPYGRGKHGIMIYIISMASGQVEQVLRGHTEVVNGLDFSPDGKHLASCSADKTARIYDLAAGRTIAEMRGHAGPIREISYSPDGTRLATASKDNTVRLWQADGTWYKTLDPVDGPILSCSWSPDSRTIVTGTYEFSIQLWDRNGQIQKKHRLNQAEKTQLVHIEFSKDGKELLYTGVDDTGRAGIIDLETGKRRIIFKEHDNTGFYCTYSPDGKLAASTGGNTNQTFIWRTANGEVLHTLVGHGKSVWGLGWSADSTSIAFGNTNVTKAGKMWPEIERTFNLENFQFGPEPDAGYRRVPTGYKGYSLHRLDFFRIQIRFNGKNLYVFQSPSKGDRLYGYSVFTGNRAVIGGSFGIFFIDLPTGRIIRRFDGHSGITSSVCPSPDGKYFLTGSVDQTICLWTPERSKPLITFFFADRNWIAWTPEGYYACSPYGERLMGWQINNGPEAMATYHPAARFRNSLYHPTLLKNLVKTGDLNQALAMSGKNPDQAVQQVNVTEVLPPMVTLVSPTTENGEVKVKSDQIEVTAAAKSVGDHPVLTMRLIVDGRPYRGERGVVQFDTPKVGVRSASWKVDLLPGKHIIQVQAESKVSKAVSSPLTVERAGGKSDQPPNLYVLAIGISDYPGPMRLNYADDDALGLAAVLQKRGAGLFKEVNCKLVLDRDATRQNINQGMRWLQSKMTDNDVGIFFFAGHGTRDSAGRFYLVPVDVRSGHPYNTCVSGDVVKTALANMPGRMIAMFDACHSGSAAETKNKNQVVATGQVSDQMLMDLVSEEYGVIVMCSSLGSEYSMESPVLQHGFFTLSLIQGLNGGADFDRDEQVFFHELDRFASRAVKVLSQGMQNPITGMPPSLPAFALSKRN